MTLWDDTWERSTSISSTIATGSGTIMKSPKRSGDFVKVFTDSEMALDSGSSVSASLQVFALR